MRHDLVTLDLLDGALETWEYIRVMSQISV